jgi:hypothetical protein
MSVRVQLSPLLRKYVPGYEHDEGLTLEGLEGKAVRDLIATLDIPPKEVYTIMVNHYPGQPNSVVKDGDFVMLAKVIGAG